MRCLAGRRRTWSQSAVVRLQLRVRSGAGIGIGDRRRTPRERPAGVDDLAARDGEEPAAQIGRVTQSRVGAQRAQHRLLEAVLGLRRPDGAVQEREHRGGMVVEEALEGRQWGRVHRGHCIPNAGPGAGVSRARGIRRVAGSRREPRPGRRPRPRSCRRRARRSGASCRLAGGGKPRAGTGRRHR